MAIATEMLPLQEQLCLWSTYEIVYAFAFGGPSLEQSLMSLAFHFLPLFALKNLKLLLTLCITLLNISSLATIFLWFLTSLHFFSLSYKYIVRNGTAS